MPKTAGVRAFKARLSKYLQEVKHGETVLVTDRGQVVARLVPPSPADEIDLPADERDRQQLLADGVVSHLGTQGQGDWPEPPKRGLVSREVLDAALAAEREDKR